MPNDENSGLKRRERKEVQRLSRLRPVVMHEIVLEEGVEELGRTFRALWWSGVAAGLSIGFSMVAAGIMKHILPDELWAQPLIAIGYTAGFMIVILGRQQLFTENTITALLPVLNDFSAASLFKMARLWAIILGANMVGAVLFAGCIALGGLVSPQFHPGFTALGEHLVHAGMTKNFLTGIAAGWLIATLVWILPSVPNDRFFTVFFFTWLIGLGGFAHIIAGSVEVLFVWFQGGTTLFHAVFDFWLPTFVGNVVGGSALFALITYAQVVDEVEGDS